MKTLASALLLLVVPAFAECGEPHVLESVQNMVLQSYFKYDKPARPVEIVSVTFQARDDSIGNYECAASVRFEAHSGDITGRRGIRSGGLIDVPFSFRVARSATDPSESIVSIYRVHALEYDF